MFDKYVCSLFCSPSLSPPISLSPHIEHNQLDGFLFVQLIDRRVHEFGWAVFAKHKSFFLIKFPIESLQLYSNWICFSVPMKTVHVYIYRFSDMWAHFS